MNAEQKQEIEVLESIFPDEWKMEIGSDVSYSMTISPEVKLFITLNEKYPSEGPPQYELLAPHLSNNAKFRISSEFDEIFQDNGGQPVLYQWISKLMEIVEKDVRKVPKIVSKKVTVKTLEESSSEDQHFDIVTGPVITDRKSKFQGHVCPVKSEIEVRAVMDKLLSNKKVAQAKHNIRAYRIRKADGVLLKDCDEDGEAHAGGPLMALLDILGVVDVLVVVTRWYGGIQLGPDRFKHYKNAARQALEHAGYIK